MASVLETFFIKFDSETSGLKKGGDAIKSLEGTIGSFAKYATGALAGAFAVGNIVSSIKAATDYADHLGEVSEAIGVNIEDLDAWGNAVKIAGGSAEGFQGTVKSLSTSFAMFATTGSSRSAPFFKELGINMVDAAGKARDVMDVLPELSKKFGEMDSQEAFGMAQKMGIDEGTFLLLKKGGAEVDAMVKRQRELGVITKETADISSDFNDAIYDTSHLFRQVFMSVGVTVIPVLNAMLKGVEALFKFIRTHEKFVIGAIVGLASALLVVFFPAIMTAVGGALMFIGSMLLLAAPFIIVAAAVGLLVDEISNWVDGNDSMIGDLLGSWTDFRENFMSIIQAVTDSWQGWIDRLSEGFTKIDELAQKVKGFFSGIGAKIGISTEATGAVEGAAQLGAAQSSPLNAATPAGIAGAGAAGNKTNTVTIGKVEVNTQATDADGISNAIGGTLNDHMSKTIDQFDDGVDR